MVCKGGGGGLQEIAPSRFLLKEYCFNVCTGSSEQVRRSLLSIGPLLYKCSIMSLAWLCVLLLYLVATR